DLAARPPAPLEDDRHAVPLEPGAGAEHLVERAHLEGEVIQAASCGFGRLAIAARLLAASHEGDAMMIAAHAEKDHSTRHYAVGIAIGDAQPEHVLVEAEGRVEVADVQHHVADLSELEFHVDPLSRPGARIGGARPGLRRARATPRPPGA